MDGSSVDGSLRDGDEHGPPLSPRHQPAPEPAEHEPPVLPRRTAAAACRQRCRRGHGLRLRLRASHVHTLPGLLAIFLLRSTTAARRGRAPADAVRTQELLQGAASAEEQEAALLPFLQLLRSLPLAAEQAAHEEPQALGRPCPLPHHRHRSLLPAGQSLLSRALKEMAAGLLIYMLAFLLCTRLLLTLTLELWAIWDSGELILK